MIEKGSGILLHITSLPSQFGIGDLGPEGYRFVDFLNQAKQSYWQVLPLNPTDAACSHSPYSSSSAFAGNPLLISPEKLEEWGLVSLEEIDFEFEECHHHVDYQAVTDFRQHVFLKSFDVFQKEKKKWNEEYNNFIDKNQFWLDDFSLFVVLKNFFDGKSWDQWPDDIRLRDESALLYFSKKHERDIDFVKFQQFLFFKQWFELKNYASKLNVKIIGDIPIYVSYDSVDVWSNPDVFKLNKDKKMEVVSGVPPDYFSETGQRWGNPVYDWNFLQETDYAWWKKRLQFMLDQYDVVRIDHFRGLVAFWEIPVQEKTAINGSWADVPYDDFFQSLKGEFDELPIIAEDLGIITDDVKELMQRQDFPGMKVLIFAFGDDLKEHPYLPHNYSENSVVYTGTHDNNTVHGWYEDEASDLEKSNFETYIRKTVDPVDVHWDMIKLAMHSPAKIVITPLQDLLGLGSSSRMNKPATIDGNWLWRFHSEALNPVLEYKLEYATSQSNRAVNDKARV